MRSEPPSAEVMDQVTQMWSQCVLGVFHTCIVVNSWSLLSLCVGDHKKQQQKNSVLSSNKVVLLLFKHRFLFSNLSTLPVITSSYSQGMFDICSYQRVSVCMRSSAITRSHGGCHMSLLFSRQASETYVWCQKHEAGLPRQWPLRQLLVCANPAFTLGTTDTETIGFKALQCWHQC